MQQCQRALRRSCCGVGRPRHCTLTRPRRSAIRVGAASTDKMLAPWQLTFDLRERETAWSDENKARLVAIVSARDLGCTHEQLDAALSSLILLLPDLGVYRLSPKLLVALVEALPLLPARLINMRGMLPPGTDISRVVAGRPQILLQPLQQLQATVAHLNRLMGQEAVGRLVEAQPMALEAGCVDAVLEEMQRLMPHGSNVVYLLSHDPSWLLKAQAGQQWLGVHPDSDGQGIELRY